MRLREILRMRMRMKMEMILPAFRQQVAQEPLTLLPRLPVVPPEIPLVLLLWLVFAVPCCVVNRRRLVLSALRLTSVMLFGVCTVSALSLTIGMAASHQ
jgi:hypothetical protein